MTPDICAKPRNAEDLTSSWVSVLFSQSDSKEPLQCTITSREDDLWRIFTYYTIQSSPSEPLHLRVSHLKRLLKMCGFFYVNEQAGSKKIQNKQRISERDVEVICTNIRMKNASPSDKSTKLSYELFVKVLFSISKMKYPQLTPHAAFEELLDKFIIPHSKRRISKSIRSELLEVEEILQMFKKPIFQIFSFYSEKSVNKKLKTGNPKLQSNSLDSNLCMDYSECLRFAIDYELISTSVVTSTGFAIIFVESLNKKQKTINFDSFCELIVRTACYAFKKAHISIRQKLCALFLIMRRLTVSESASEISYRSNLRIANDCNGKINRKGSNLFDNTFDKMWTKDNYSDYLLQGDMMLSKNVSTNGGTMNEIKAVLNSPRNYKCNVDKSMRVSVN